jgi:hypothetical protein
MARGFRCGSPDIQTVKEHTHRPPGHDTRRQRLEQTYSMCQLVVRIDLSENITMSK